MAIRHAEGIWHGTLKEGKGTMKLASGAFEGAYSFSSRFEEGTGTNPEELIGAAHAGCFSMAFSAGLERAGFPATKIHTKADVHFSKQEPGWRITKIVLNTEAEVPGIDEAAFQEQAEAAKVGCPISNALSVEIELNAKLMN